MTPTMRKQRTTAHARLREAAEAANYTPSCGDNWVAQRTIDGYKVFGYEASGGPVEMLACEPTEARAFRAAAKYLEAERELRETSDAALIANLNEDGTFKS